MSARDGKRVKGMVRDFDQWRNMEPAAVMAGSQAQIEFALRDAKHDIAMLEIAVRHSAFEHIAQHLERQPSFGDGKWAAGIVRAMKEAGE